MRLSLKQWSLATKWSLMLTALAVGPLLAVISYSYTAASAQMLKQSVVAMANSTSDAASAIDDAVAERVRQAQYLANLPSVREFAAAQAYQRPAAQASMQEDLVGLQTAYPYMESFDLLDPQGVVIFSTSGYKGLDREPALLKTVAAGQVYMAGLRSQADKPGQALVIAAPVGKPGALQGIVRTQSSPEFLAQRVARDHLRQGEGVVGMLLDESGRAIARSDGQSGDDVLQVQPDGRLMMPGGAAYFAQAAKLEAVPWKYVLAVPEGSLQAELESQRRRALVLSLAVSLVIGGIARLLALGFTKPLSRMAAATRALAEGDLTHEIPAVPQHDEVGQLQNAFNEAYGQLRRLVARMRLSSILVAEAADHLHVMTASSQQTGVPVATASQKLSHVAKDLERQVAHFKV